MKTRIAIFTCLLLFLPPAVATAAEGLYMSGHLGASWLSDADFDGSNPAIRLRSEVEFDPGVHLGAAIGYDFGRFRFEGEFGYRSNEFKEMKDIELNGLPLGNLDADGDLDAFLFMVNGFYDFDTGTKFTPYLGGGIGFASLEINDISIAGIINGDEDDSVFAYQLAGGVGYEITEQIVVDLSYRFVATADPDFGTIESEYHSHTLMAGIRFFF
jgi:opacity protein-like surface antigen